MLDVEVADGLPALVDDAEAQLLGAAAAQLGLLDDDAQVAGRDGEAADGLCGEEAWGEVM